eukprot:g5136.t1
MCRGQTKRGRRTAFTLGVLYTILFCSTMTQIEGMETLRKAGRHVYNCISRGKTSPGDGSMDRLLDECIQLSDDMGTTDQSHTTAATLQPGQLRGPPSSSISSGNLVEAMRPESRCTHTIEKMNDILAKVEGIVLEDEIVQMCMDGRSKMSFRIPSPMGKISDEGTNARGRIADFTRPGVNHFDDSFMDMGLREGELRIHWTRIVRNEATNEYIYLFARTLKHPLTCGTFAVVEKGTSEEKTPRVFVASTAVLSTATRDLLKDLHVGISVHSKRIVLSDRDENHAAEYQEVGVKFYRCIPIEESGVELVALTRSEREEQFTAYDVVGTVSNVKTFRELYREWIQSGERRGAIQIRLLLGNEGGTKKSVHVLLVNEEYVHCQILSKNIYIVTPCSQASAAVDPAHGESSVPDEKFDFNEFLFLGALPGCSHDNSGVNGRTMIKLMNGILDFICDNTASPDVVKCTTTIDDMATMTCVDRNYPGNEVSVRDIPISPVELATNGKLYYERVGDYKQLNTRFHRVYSKVSEIQVQSARDAIERSLVTCPKMWNRLGQVFGLSADTDPRTFSSYVHALFQCAKTTDDSSYAFPDGSCSCCGALADLFQPSPAHHSVWQTVGRTGREPTYENALPSPNSYMNMFGVVRDILQHSAPAMEDSERSHTRKRTN